MLHAAIRGKLSCLDLEDPLTAAVFGRLKYLPVSVVASWFANARPWPLEPSRSPPEFFKGVDALLPSFWPQWQDTLRGAGIVEPDIAFFVDGSLIIVEAKLWSGKSGSSFFTEAEEERPADQLARQWKAAIDYCMRELRGTLAPAALVYLTPHLAPPSHDLDESIAEMHKYGDGANLFWLSWSSLEAPLRDLVGMNAVPQASIAEDILAYLDEVGVLRFHSWRSSGYASELVMWRYHRPPVQPYFVEVENLSLRSTWLYSESASYSFVETQPPTPVWTYSRSTTDGH
jgi:hypothetical protein